jgi:hypothetical protein
LKASLGKSQTLFKALAALRRIFRGILPKKIHPNLEWNDASENISISLHITPAR